MRVHARIGVIALGCKAAAVYGSAVDFKYPAFQLLIYGISGVGLDHYTSVIFGLRLFKGFLMETASSPSSSSKEASLLMESEASAVAGTSR